MEIGGWTSRGSRQVNPIWARFSIPIKFPEEKTTERIVIGPYDLIDKYSNFGNYSE